MAALLLSASLSPSLASAHVPIPPKDRSEISRREAKTPVADFKLTNQDGKPFQFKNSRGKVVLATFIFTTCPDVCPLLTAKFAAIQRTLDENKSRDYLLLSITTDPKIFRVNVMKTQAGDVNHTTLTTLIDRQGNRRVDYYGDKWQDKEVLKEIQWLRSQKP
jgi:protein SCO1/2